MSWLANAAAKAEAALNKLDRDGGQVVSAARETLADAVPPPPRRRHLGAPPRPSSRARRPRAPLPRAAGPFEAREPPRATPPPPVGSRRFARRAARTRPRARPLPLGRCRPDGSRSAFAPRVAPRRAPRARRRPPRRVRVRLARGRARGRRAPRVGRVRRGRDARARTDAAAKPPPTRRALDALRAKRARPDPTPPSAATPSSARAPAERPRGAPSRRRGERSTERRRGATTPRTPRRTRRGRTPS